jgi:hypothetical protein
VSDELDRHVERFNDGVRTGNFDPLLEGFADDGVLVFEGVPAGPFVGVEAIRTAYRERPPDDEIVVLATRPDGDDEVATYAWRAAPDAPAGQMRFARRDGLTTRLAISFFPDERS